jgi:RNA polymerase sigma-70 factor (ECF subfamily)
MTEETDVLLAQKGDAAAAERLLRGLYPLLYRLLARMMNDRTAAEDVAQETCIRIIRKLKDFRGDSAFRSWALAIGYNAARDAMRHARYRAHQSLDAAENVASTTPAGEDSILMRQIWQAVDALPEHLRDTAHLIWGEGYTQEEAAQIMECAVKTVEGRVADIKKRLHHLKERSAV